MRYCKETTSEPEAQVVVEQYQQIVSRYNTLLATLYSRTQYKEWEDPFYVGPGTTLGVGSCYLGTDDSNFGITHPDLLRLRQERSASVEGKRVRGACGHHRAGVGCILDDLKSPLCLHYIPEPLLQEMKDRFGFEFTIRFMENGKRALKIAEYLQKPQLDPVAIRYNVHRAVEALEHLAIELRQFPELNIQR